MSVITLIAFSLMGLEMESTGSSSINLCKTHTHKHTKDHEANKHIFSLSLTHPTPHLQSSGTSKDSREQTEPTDSKPHLPRVLIPCSVRRKDTLGWEREIRKSNLLLTRASTRVRASSAGWEDPSFFLSALPPTCSRRAIYHHEDHQLLSVWELCVSVHKLGS